MAADTPRPSITMAIGALSLNASLYVFKADGYCPSLVPRPLRGSFRVLRLSSTSNGHFLSNVRRLYGRDAAIRRVLECPNRVHKARALYKWPASSRGDAIFDGVIKRDKNYVLSNVPVSQAIASGDRARVLSATNVQSRKSVEIMFEKHSRHFEFASSKGKCPGMFEMFADCGIVEGSSKSSYSRRSRQNGRGSRARRRSTGRDRYKVLRNSGTATIDRRDCLLEPIRVRSVQRTVRVRSEWPTIEFD